MLYFPMIDTHLPDWLPKWGGDRFIFFQPIFNIADSAITVGVVSLLLFNRSFFTRKEYKGIDETATKKESSEEE